MTQPLLAALLLMAGPLGPSPFSATPPADLPPAGTATAATALPGWLAGTWAMERGADWADAMWLGPRGDSMLGVTRSGFGPDVQAWESLRIVRRAGSLVLLVQPKGGTAIEFPLSFASAEAIEFANPANEFPQRIRYARAGQLLIVEQSRMDGSDAVRSNYRPVQTGVD